MKIRVEYRSITFQLIIAGFLVFGCLSRSFGQTEFRKPQRRSHNLLEMPGPYLKTIFSFKPTGYDTLYHVAPDPLQVPIYQDTNSIPVIFDAVFNHRVKVYNPNFWGSVPQLIKKTSYDRFDTLEILNYLQAGWDTSLMIDNDGNVQSFAVYRDIPFNEISGIFFFESWWLDRKNYKMYKDIVAYLPIREYLSTFEDGVEAVETRRRLLFMVIPEWSTGVKKPVKNKPGNFQLIYKDLRYEIQLFNKSYQLYLYRESEYGQISQTEFNEWQYHYFDFYRDFDANLFLERIITGVLNGKLKAFLPGKPESTLKREDFVKLILGYPDIIEMQDTEKGYLENGSHFAQKSELLPEDYPISDLNSIEFHEDWYINYENLQIYKDVKGLTVNRTEILEDQYTGEFIQESVKPLFSIRF